MILAHILCVAIASAPLPASPEFPRVQVIPQPDDRASFQVDGIERLAYHHPERYIRPYWYPLIGPAGRPVTRITHPRDPNSHSHHKSIWIAHAAVNDLDFWSDATKTRIVHQAVVEYADGPRDAAMSVRNRWLDPAGKAILSEVRTARLRPLAGGETQVDIEIAFTPAAGAVTFGKTPFGFLGGRVAKTMGVHDGGGRILNSEGASGEAQILWKRARWVDYAGPIAPGEENGLTLMDHPSNPRHPTHFHVRGDGWMGASFCCDEPYVLEPGKTLSLRYRLYAHRGALAAGAIEARWKEFAAQ
ncbi:MAG: PmoA family protein [Planctomycetes bacterium]|nr:PmoA family protein [Planctomycetota bacterium]